MGQVRHGSATTTHAVRAAIQRSQASLATLTVWSATLRFSASSASHETGNGRTGAGRRAFPQRWCAGGRSVDHCPQGVIPSSTQVRAAPGSRLTAAAMSARPSAWRPVRRRVMPRP